MILFQKTLYQIFLKSILYRIGMIKKVRRLISPAKGWAGADLAVTVKSYTFSPNIYLYIEIFDIIQNT